MPPPKRIEMGHFTGFLGRRNYPQSYYTRPFELGKLFEQASGERRALPHRHHDLEAPEALRDLLGICQVVAEHLHLYVRR